LALKASSQTKTKTRRVGRSKSSPRLESELARPTDRGVQDVADLEREALSSRSRLDQIATSITGLAGSGAAILVHAVWFTIWVVVNQGFFGFPPFDPFPYSLLTTIVSLEAIFLTLFVLISQNRMSREADHERVERRFWSTRSGSPSGLW
jgi:uncharacterized membrane protein